MNKEVSIKVNARHIGQLGRELVTDYVTALTELVKNSYDADGESVEISFQNVKDGDGRIIVADTGKGFTIDDIVNKWAVIGTNSKVKDPYSEKYSRRCAGRKGIGRYSVERLAEHCTLYTFSQNEEPIKYYTNWNYYEGIDLNETKQRVEILKNHSDIDSAKYIKRLIEYLISNKKIDDDSKGIIRSEILRNDELSYKLFYDSITLRNIERVIYPICEKYIDLEEKIEDIKNVAEILEGKEREFYFNQLVQLYEKTRMDEIEIDGPYTGTFLVLDCLRDEWKYKDLEKVTKELKLLVSPIKEEKNNFIVYINAPEFDINEVKLTNNILNQRYAQVNAQFDAKENRFLATYVDRDGETQTVNQYIPEIYICGDFDIVLYYFLRDSSLKHDGLKVNEVKEILDAFCGVKIYRDGFRVRPYGEEGNDWLLLDHKKIKDTHSYRIGNNQVIGVVNINSDNNPLLVDATNREAIIESESFEQLKDVVLKCINLIENHRYDKYQEEKRQSKIAEEELYRIGEKKQLSQVIKEQQSIVEEAVIKNDTKKAVEVIETLMKTVMDDQKKEEQHYKKTKKEYEKKLRESDNELRLYKNLAALGILAGSFGHETDDAIARILLNIEYPKERVMSIFESDEDLISSFNDLDSDINRISCYSDLLVSFLKKKKRSEAVILSFKQVINEIVAYYDILVDEYSVKIDTSGLHEFDCMVPMKQIDLESVIINLLSNSFEALKGVRGERCINISSSNVEYGYSIIVEDSGPGVPDDIRDWIFIPLNTTKEDDGVGLGLTIVKDVLKDYGGTIVPKDGIELSGARFEVFIPDREVYNG